MTCSLVIKSPRTVSYRWVRQANRFWTYRVDKTETLEMRVEVAQLKLFIRMLERGGEKDKWRDWWFGVWDAWMCKLPIKRGKCQLDWRLEPICVQMDGVH